MLVEVTVSRKKQIDEATMTANTNMKPTLQLLITTAVLLLAHAPTHAQDRIDPRHPSFTYMQEWGTMDGTTLQCLPGWKEEALGKSIIPTGDLNNDGLADYIIERTRCDTAFGPNKTTRGNELLLFYGRKNKLPTSAEGLRIGPTEIGSNSQCLAIGDFDGDSYPDLACRYNLLGDTSFSNSDALYTLSQVVVFWNDRTGRFSLNDTSRLVCDGPVWLGGRQAIADDFTNDGMTDLLIQTSAKQWNYGTLIQHPDSTYSQAKQENGGDVPVNLGLRCFDGGTHQPLTICSIVTMIALVRKT